MAGTSLNGREFYRKRNALIWAEYSRIIKKDRSMSLARIARLIRMKYPKLVIKSETIRKLLQTKAGSGQEV
jgi:hypothetical protein